jgi:tetratricopeptide (TPR) repeat protein
MSSERTRCANGNDATQTLLIAASGRCGALIDAALSRQHEDWLKGIRIPIADRLRACGALCADPIQAAELIYHEFVLQRESGETPDWESLVRQFPEYAEQLQHFREADELLEGAISPTGRSATQLGSYDLLEQIGRGGMGVVYRARERNLDRTVAIKRIRGGALADDDTVQRFLKEARAVSRLNHPNIVHIYCVGDCEAEPFIALEFVEGPTLAERIGGTPLAPRLAGTIGEAVALAIQHAHEHGIVHRDLKPANILLCESPDGPVPKVTDFGAATELERATDRGRTKFLGTPSYMAPEQVEPKWGPISQLTDVYGIGALLYETLTGRPPFRADSIGETLRQVIEAEPVSPRLLNPAVPRDLETVCLKCLQKEPERRYDSAAALADDLERFLAGQPIRARSIGPTARVWMWCRRKPGTASLVAVLLLSLVGGMAGITLQWRRAEAARKSAVASDLEAQQILSELVQSNVVYVERGQHPVAPSIDSLLRAEVHCKRLLQKNPGEITVRIALTKVCRRLVGLYWQRGQAAEADAILQQTIGLLEPLASDAAANPDYRYWLAETYELQRLDDPPRYLQSFQQAYAILEKLADDQPGNPDFMLKIWDCRSGMICPVANETTRNDWLPLVETDTTQLERHVRQNPADRVLRKRLALNCFLLGEIYAENRSADKASSYWRESYEHYSILAEGDFDNLLVHIMLAISSSRLIQGPSTDPYYLQAVSHFERAAKRLNAMLKREPQRDWLRDLLLEDYCYLALCHGKVGRTAKAEQACKDCLPLLTTPLDTERSYHDSAMAHALMLVEVGGRLRAAKQPATALKLVRQAATIASQLAANPGHKLSFLEDLNCMLTTCSALANQLGDPVLSLQQAELSRGTVEELVRRVPELIRRNGGLTAVYERIAKARWSLGQRDQALAAFRESAAIQKRIVEREPSNHVYRERLGQYYSRLAYYASRGGDLAGAADALLERVKLWPNDTNRLAQTAEAFGSLAQQVSARDRGHLSRGDQAEHDRYLTESRRFRKAAEAATGRAGHYVRVER